MTRFFAAGVILSVGICVNAQAPQILDLTRPDRTRIDKVDTPADERREASVARSPHETREQTGLQLTLESLDKDAYQDGERFEFRLDIENVGRKPVRIPWGSNRQQVVTGPGAPLMRALITIDVPSKLPNLMIPIATLYGSQFSPADTKVLSPGEKGQIIAEGVWDFMGYSTSDLTAAGVPPNVSVKARIVFLSTIDGHSYSDLQSTNEIPITLSRRVVR
jgi:hypothetical protein